MGNWVSKRPSSETTMAAFVYGTLMAPEVVQALIKRVPLMKPAKLRGYIRHSVKGVVFPAIVPADDSEDTASVVQGLVILELTDSEIDILDAYESMEYYRETVQTVLEDGSSIEADVYVWKDEYKSSLENTPWDYEAFRTHHLQHYLNTVEEFMKGLESS